uniref:Acyltransferase n=1 Tax=Ananas comosus var. bracteatus TaxID=296719 RepID=A0A6V7Q776_ANACO|nr:unnamed protein product [Ananas comosus var. bracteatus]
MPAAAAAAPALLLRLPRLHIRIRIAASAQAAPPSPRPPPPTLRAAAPADAGGGGGSWGGIDGVGVGLIRHHERLGKIFDIWCLHIPVMDRTPFEGLIEYVERTVKSEKLKSPEKPIYLVGESIGACLALAVAARNPDIDLILILANPGNSMRMTSAYVGGDLSLEEAVRTFSESLNVALPFLSFLAEVLPKESLLWKLRMLRLASSFVNSRLHAVKAETLILASGRDELLPSREEAERLSGTLPNCRIRHFKDNGHTIFLEGGIDLVTIIKRAGYYRRSRQIDYVSDYLLATPTELQKVREEYRLINFASSPVMLSTLEDGKIVRGLEGGAREAMHRKGEQYKLFWPERAEFVRMASRFGATIIPFGVIGEDDICELLFDYDDLVKVPFYDILDKRINEAAVRVRKQELRDKAKAQELYMDVKCEVERCLAYLQEKREKDPYRNIFPRTLFQLINGLM